MFGLGWKVAALMGALAVAGGGYGVWQGKVAEKANARAARLFQHANRENLCLICNVAHQNEARRCAVCQGA